MLVAESPKSVDVALRVNRGQDPSQSLYAACQGGLCAKGSTHKGEVV